MNNASRAAIIFSTHNKNDMLPNVLTAIAKQKTSFPFEVCIVDDASEQDPESIIRTYIPDAKYLRLPQHVGFAHAPNKCLDMLSSDVNVIVIMSSDIIMLRSDVVQNLVNRVQEKLVVFSEVLNTSISIDMYRNFDIIAQKMTNEWGNLLYENMLSSQLSNQNRRYHLQVTRYNPQGWLFFLGAILRFDLENLGYRENSCDAVLASKLRQQSFKAEILTYVPSVHQYHQHVESGCDRVETCTTYCSRTSKFKGLLQPFYSPGAII